MSWGEYVLPFYQFIYVHICKRCLFLGVIKFNSTLLPFFTVAKMVIVSCALSLAAIHYWPFFQMDVFNVFSQGDDHGEVFMALPQGFGSKGETSNVCTLKKSA